MLRKELEKLNLNEKEAGVYLAMLELGETNIERISEKSKIRRTTVYDVLEDLSEKGLAGHIKNKKRTLYYAEDPRKLEEQLDEKKMVLKNILPELMSVANLIDKKPKIRYFEGIEGIKNVYKDTLKYSSQEILMWGSPEVIKHFDNDWLWNYYVPRRIRNKIWMRAIGLDMEVVKNIKSQDEKHLRKTRLSPYSQFPFEVEINLYGNGSIGIMSFKEQFGLIIESKKIYNTLKSIFEMNWNSLAKTESASPKTYLA